jgi:hypothetical protein
VYVTSTRPGRPLSVTADGEPGHALGRTVPQGPAVGHPAGAATGPLQYAYSSTLGQVAGSQDRPRERLERVAAFGRCPSGHEVTQQTLLAFVLGLAVPGTHDDVSTLTTLGVEAVVVEDEPLPRVVRGAYGGHVGLVSQGTSVIGDAGGASARPQRR